MTAELALEYIKRRTVELCFNDGYTLRVRHFVLQPRETRKVDGHNQFFILLEPFCSLRIQSDAAVFDMTDDQLNEQQYEHRGEIILINQKIFVNHARFIQVIPNFCTPCL